MRFPGKLEEARGNELYDAGEEFRLYARDGQTPHFFALGTTPRTLTDGREESDPAHDARIDHLLNVLDGWQKGELGTNVWNEDAKKSEWAAITQIGNYKWGREVFRALGETTKCRHDLFGASTELSLTARCPWVAIEVIKSHYLNQQTFDGLLKLTRMLPCVVLFDLVDAPNYFMAIDLAKRRIRSIYYLYEGRVWKNGKEEQIATALQFAANLKRMLPQREA